MVRCRTLEVVDCGARRHLMKIYALGIDPDKTANRLGFKWAGRSTERMFSHATAGLYREFAGAVDRHGSLQ